MKNGKVLRNKAEKIGLIKKVLDYATGKTPEDEGRKINLGSDEITYLENNNYKSNWELLGVILVKEGQRDKVEVSEIKKEAKVEEGTKKDDLEKGSVVVKESNEYEKWEGIKEEYKLIDSMQRNNKVEKKELIKKVLGYAGGEGKEISLDRDDITYLENNNYKSNWELLGVILDGLNLEQAKKEKVEVNLEKPVVEEKKENSEIEIEGKKRIHNGGQVDVQSDKVEVKILEGGREVKVGEKLYKAELTRLELDDLEKGVDLRSMKDVKFISLKSLKDLEGLGLPIGTSAVLVGEEVKGILKGLNDILPLEKAVIYKGGKWEEEKTEN